MNVRREFTKKMSAMAPPLLFGLGLRREAVGKKEDADALAPALNRRTPACRANRTVVSSKMVRGQNAAEQSEPTL